MASRLLLAFQILAHLGLVFLIIYGTMTEWLICLTVYFLTGCLGMSVTFHRLLSHRSWKSPRWFENLGSFLGTYGLTGSPIAWVAIHRQHHVTTDSELDPHSPHHKGILRAQFASMFEMPRLRYSKDLVRQPFQKFLHRNYFLIHVSILALLLVAYPRAAVFAYLAPAAILWNMGSLTNTLGHLFGYKNHDINNMSVNNWFLGYFGWGEGWHNNHHHRPSAWNFSERWYEFDLGGWVIRALRK